MKKQRARKLASDGVVDLTETRRLDDGRVVTKDENSQKGTNK